jgi:hypothetical protein
MGTPVSAELGALRAIRKTNARKDNFSNEIRFMAAKLIIILRKLKMK